MLPVVLVLLVLLVPDGCAARRWTATRCSGARLVGVAWRRDLGAALVWHDWQAAAAAAAAGLEDVCELQIKKPSNSTSNKVREY